MTVLEADQNGLTRRQIAELLWGRERVAQEWYPDGWMHGRVKRRLANARAMLKDTATSRRDAEADGAVPTRSKPGCRLPGREAG